MIRTVGLVLLSLNALVNAASLPSSFPRCSRNDPNLGDCILKSFPSYMKQTAQGIKELSLPSLDPLSVASYSVNQNNGPITINITVTNGTGYGFSKLKLESVKIDLKKGKIDLSLTIPLLDNYGLYDMKGRFLLLPINGNGKADYVFKDMRGNMEMDFEHITRKGKKYMTLKKLELIDFEIGGATYNFENLFNGDKILSDSTNAVINENWKDFTTAMSSSFIKVWEKYFMSYVGRIFDSIPFDDLFPEK